jgi:hypothetical protein
MNVSSIQRFIVGDMVRHPTTPKTVLGRVVCIFMPLEEDRLWVEVEWVPNGLVSVHLQSDLRRF